MKIVATALALLTLFSASSLLSAATINVPGDQPTIQAGLAASSPGDTVLVACGTYYEHDLDLGVGRTLRSEAGEANCVTIDAQGEGRVLFTEGTENSVLIEGITITGGQAWEGAGLWCRISAYPTIRSCDFIGNSAGYIGGGLEVYSYEYVRPILENCRFRGNTAQYGAAIYVGGSGVDAHFCDVIGNEASEAGGGFYGGGGGTFTNCTFSLNSAPLGAGAFIVEGTFRPINTVLWENSPDACHIGEPWGHIDVTCSIAQDGTQHGFWTIDPLFCDPLEYDFSVAGDSPCLPEHNDCGMLIGAREQGCGSVATGDASWSSVKSLY